MKWFVGVIIFGLLIFSCSRTPRDVKIIAVKDGRAGQDDTLSAEIYQPIRVAVSAILSPRETFDTYEDLFKYISDEIDMPIEFHQRKTYQEINQMLETGKLDLAFICTGGYVSLDPDGGVELLVIPVSGGKEFYKAYVITHLDFNANGLQDLRNTTFAFTDPLSNTGYLYVNERLKEMGENPESFFASTVFTYGHDISIQMVSRGIIEAASVSHLVFEYLRAKDPQKVENIRIIEESMSFGMPPVVVSGSLNEDMRQRILDLFINMHVNPSAKPLLDELLIDRFVGGHDGHYNSTREFYDRFN